MELGIQNRTAIVIGASKGIGRSCFDMLAREGCKVIGIARSEDIMSEVCHDICDSGLNAQYEIMDMMSAIENGQLTDYTRSLIAKYGPVDIVIHAIGGSLGNRDPLANWAGWRTALQYNAGIAVDMNSVLIPEMVNRKWGRVVHISSISAVMLRGNAEYASAKAFLNAYTTTVGRAVAPANVVMSAVMPGAVAFDGSYWDNFVKQQHPRVDDFLKHHQAIGRMGTPDEIASFVCLLSSELASFASGAILPVDGGNM